MKQWNIRIEKLTDIDLLRKAASFTTGHECKMSLLTAYKNKHSIIRSQIFVIEMINIPLFCASQFVRSSQGVNWYQRTKRTDRGGANFIDECRRIESNLNEVLVVAEDNKVPDSNMIRKAQSDVLNLTAQFDRYAPTDLCGIMNAEAVMNMSAKRLCLKASDETRRIWQDVLHGITQIDPDLIKFCVKPCVAHCGICREHKPCGFNKSEMAKKLIEQYKLLFV